MDVLFIASTTAQLMNAMTLCSTVFKDDNCDLYYGVQIRKNVDRVRELSYFRDCYQFPVLRSFENINTPVKKAKAALEAFFKWRGLYKACPADVRSYERMLIPGFSLTYFLNFYSIKRINKSLKLSLYEEGICEYYTLGYEKSKKKRLHDLVFGTYFYDCCDSVYVHHPEIVDNVMSNIVVKPMVSPVVDEQLRNDIGSVLGYEDSGLKNGNKRIVFVDTSHKGMGDEDERERKQAEALKFITDLVGKEAVTVKLHPSSAPLKYGNGYDYLDLAYPMELVGFHEDVSDLIFVSINSSATVNFKLLLDLEPCVILLQEVLFADTTMDTKVSALFNRIKGLYDTPKFFIPADYDELKQCLTACFYNEER